MRLPPVSTRKRSSSRSGELRQRQHAQPGGRQFEGEREVVEPAAQLGDDRLGVGVDRERGTHRRPAFGEQLDGGVGTESADREQRLAGRRPSGSRLVAITSRSGISPSRASTTVAAASTTCSQLSSTITSDRPRRWPSRTPTAGAVAPHASAEPGPPAPSAVTIAAATASGSRTAASSTSQAPSRYSGCRDGRGLHRETGLAGATRADQRHKPPRPGDLDESGQVVVAADERRQRRAQISAPTRIRRPGADPQAARRASDPGRAPAPRAPSSRGPDRCRAPRPVPCEPRRTPATRRPGDRRGTTPTSTAPTSAPATGDAGTAPPTPPPRRHDDRGPGRPRSGTRPQTTPARPTAPAHRARTRRTRTRPTPRHDTTPTRTCSVLDAAAASPATSWRRPSATRRSKRTTSRSSGAIAERVAGIRRHDHRRTERPPQLRHRACSALSGCPAAHRPTAR